MCCHSHLCFIKCYYCFADLFYWYISDFPQLDVDGNGKILLSELGTALEACGIKIAGYEQRDGVTGH